MKGHEGHNVQTKYDNTEAICWTCGIHFVTVQKPMDFIQLTVNVGNPSPSPPQPEPFIDF